MRLIENDHKTFPLFMADSIADIKRSRDEISALLDPKHIQLYKKMRYLPIDAMLLGVSHNGDGSKYDSNLGIWLYDHIDKVNVQIPTRFQQMARKLFGDDTDFDYLVRRSWWHKPVVLRISYAESHGWSEDEGCYHTLQEVLDMPRPARASKAVENKLPPYLSPGAVPI